MKKIISVTLIVFSLIKISDAQTFVPDVTFGSGGTFISSNPGTGYFEKAIAFQPDGKILISTGGNVLGLGRLNADGTLDNSFGTNGWVTVGNYTIGDIAIQPDGKILTAQRPTDISYFDIYVSRYNSNGTIDYTFGNNGVVGDSTLGSGYEQIELQTDGKIILSGGLGFKRLNANGSKDLSFGNNGYLHSNQIPIAPVSIAIDNATGNIIAGGVTKVGNNFAIIRVTPVGQLDNVFGSNGVDSINYQANALGSSINIRLTNSGKIVLGSDFYPSVTSHLICAQFNSNGTIDATFGNGGIVLPSWNVDHGYEYFGGIAIQSDNKIIIACTSLDTNALINNRDVALQRLNTDGTYDASFGLPRLDINHSSEFVSAVAIQADGKPVVNADTETSELIARFTNGTLSINNLANELVDLNIYPNPTDKLLTVYSSQLSIGDEIKIIDLNGRVVERKIISTKTDNAQLTTENFVNGICFIQIISNKNSISKKIIIKH